MRTVPTPFPDDLHQETDLNCGEGDHAAVGYDFVNDNMELMSENNVLAQGIIFESEEGSKCDSKIFSFFFSFFAVAPIIMCPCSLGFTQSLLINMASTTFKTLLKSVKLRKYIQSIVFA